MSVHAPSTRMLMACIGDASRFRLVQALLGGARCVTDLAGEVGLSQSCTTRHLQALERRRVVCGARDGKRVMYRLCHEEPSLGPLLAWALDPAAAGPGGRFKSMAKPRPARVRPPEAGTSTPRGAPHATAVVGAAQRAIAPVASPTESSGPPATSEATAARPRRSDLEDYLL